MKHATCLVTGGAGFIGSHVVDHLLALGNDVVVLDDLSGGYKENINKNAIFQQGSILNEKLLDDLFAIHKFSYVYHLAAYAAEGLSHFIRKFNYENNLIGSVNLINRAVKHNVKHFVFTSSIAVYGSNQTPMTEDLIPLPEDPYGIAKFAVEMDLKSANHMFGLSYTIFRPHNVYGERQNIADPYRNVIGIFLNNIMHDKPMTIFGDGTQTRAFSYIDDVAPYIARSPLVEKAKQQIINIGADQPYSVNQLAKVVAKTMGVKPAIQYLAARKEVLHAFSDHTKAKTIFGIKKIISLDEGINKMATWAKEFGPKNPKLFTSIEINQNLPASWAKLVQQ